MNSAVFRLKCIDFLDNTKRIDFDDEEGGVWEEVGVGRSMGRRGSELKL